jgi:septal ring factor EnvC (AmiA/AmiB activator)
LLRAIYDMVDRLKAWETDNRLDGAAMLGTVQNNLALAISKVEPRAGGRAHNGRHGPHELRGEGTTARAATIKLTAGEAAESAGLRDGLDDARHMRMQAMQVQLRSIEAQLRERIETERKTSLSLTSTRDELDETIAALAGTRNDLDETRSALDRNRTMLDQTRTALDQTRGTLDQTQGTLDQTQGTLDQTRGTLDRTRGTLDRTQGTLDQTRADLTSVNLESERLSGSARLFIRQYLPRLRRHLWRRFA